MESALLAETESLFSLSFWVVWDLSSLTRDQICALWIGSAES